jgi:hypothetical protein
MSESLVDRLRAALDEDERVAQAAARVITELGATWQGLADGLWKRSVRDDDEVWDFIERHDPARVLRQVAAMRKILDWVASGHHCTADHLLSPADPDDVADLLAEAYGIEVEG